MHPVKSPRPIGERLRERRKKSGITLTALAECMGFSAPYLVDLEHGRRAFRDELREKYEAALSTLTAAA